MEDDFQRRDMIGACLMRAARGTPTGNCSKGILYVCGDKDVVRSRDSHGSQVVDHLVRPKDISALYWKSPTALVMFKRDACGHFEKYFKHSDGSDPTARLLA